MATITGVVVVGDRRGRELGFPTANVRLGVDRDRLDFGVYGAVVDGRPAAVSIGVRPTFGQDLEPLLEAHILDFDGDLYGQEIEVRLLQFIRPERAFCSADALVAEMHRDVAAARRIVEEHAPSA